MAETTEFRRRAENLFSTEEVDELIELVAYNPTLGEVMGGTGGVRKLRWSAKGKGKRGGARVIYYYHNEHMPIFLFTAYAKSVKTDLSPAQRRELKRLVSAIVEEYRGKTL